MDLGAGAVKTDAEVRVVQPQAQERQGLPASGRSWRGRKDPLLEPPTPRSQTSGQETNTRGFDSEKNGFELHKLCARLCEVGKRGDGGEVSGGVSGSGFLGKERGRFATPASTPTGSTWVHQVPL